MNIHTAWFISVAIAICLLGGMTLALQDHVIKQGKQIKQLEVALAAYKGETK